MATGADGGGGIRNEGGTVTLINSIVSGRPVGTSRSITPQAAGRRAISKFFKALEEAEQQYLNRHAPSTLSGRTTTQVQLETATPPSLHMGVGARERRDVDETQGAETRQRIDRWITEGQYLLGRLPGALAEGERLRAHAEQAERECETLRQAISRLQTENDYFQRERAETAQAVYNVMNQMVQLTNEIIRNLRGPARTSSIGQSGREETAG